MLYPYMELADETAILHTQVKQGNTVEVQFERPTENGFDSARCVLPTYEWISREGFTDDEIAFFVKFLESNAHLISVCRNRGCLSCQVCLGLEAISSFSGQMKTVNQYMCILQRANQAKAQQKCG